MEKMERNRQVIELAEQGLSYSDIAEIVGLTRQRVSQICLKNGIIRRRKDVRPDKWEKDWQESRAKKFQ